MAGIGYPMSPLAPRRQRSSPFGLNQNGMPAPAVVAPYHRDFPALSESSGSYSGGGGSYNTASAPYLPPGFQAPAPAYIDAMNRTQEQGDLRRRRINDNYSKNYPTAPSSAQGFAPPAGGLVSPMAPNLATGGTTAATGQKVKPYNPTDRAGTRQTYLGAPIYNPAPMTFNKDSNSYVETGPKTVAGYSNYPGVPVADALKTAGEQADKDLAPPMYSQGAPAAAAPQIPYLPQQSHQPTSDGVRAPGSSLPGGKASINVSTQQAQTMWDSLKRSYPNTHPDQLKAQFREMMHHYGIAPSQADALADAAGQAPQGGQVVPGRTTPISMLGPSNGMDPATKNAVPMRLRGAGRQAQPGPTVQAMPSIQQTPAPAREGYTPVAGTYDQEGNTLPRPRTQPANTPLQSGSGFVGAGQQQQAAPAMQPQQQAAQQPPQQGLYGAGGQSSFGGWVPPQQQATAPATQPAQPQQQAAAVPIHKKVNPDGSIERIQWDGRQWVRIN